MPSVTSTSNVPSPRTPAWKRIGLKLKSSQETIATPLSTAKPTQDLEGSKRKRATDTKDLTPAKKAKKREKGPAVVATTHTDSTPTLSRKKSVTFTPETKEEDGDSIKQLFSAWVQEQKAQDPTFGTKTASPAFRTPEPPKVEEQIDSTLDESERRVKRVKKPKGAKAKVPEKSPTSNTVKSTKVGQAVKAPLRPFLAYLKQYSESRETWKFSKNHQDRLLKHIFDADVIPAEYSPQIYEYVRGLQGGVRTRLRDSALAVKVKDQEDGVAGFPATMKDASKRQQEYDAAIGEYVATMTAAGVHADVGFEEGVLLGLSDAAMEKRTLKRARSERILMELGSQIEKGEEPTAKEVLEESQKRFRMEDGSAQKLRRKRKQRTMAVESDTSSSEDSSDSESDSDGSSSSSSDGSTPGTREDDDTSSSSSSSSGSEGDSDSESSSEEGGDSSDSD